MRQPLVGFFAQVFVLRLAFGTFKNRQQRINVLQNVVAALGNVNGVGHRFRQVGKQRHHFGRGFQALVGRVFFPVVVGHVFAAGDTDQCVVRLVHVGVKEKGLVGRHQRNVMLVGQIDKIVFGFGFLFEADTRNFHIQPVTEYFF